jgi:Ricin-type beta-trefoil lectin domain-like/PQQ enzyme repeat
MFRCMSPARLTPASFIFISPCLFHAQLLSAASILTQHNDLGRSGANPNETILTTSNVGLNSFGKLFSLAIDGFTYAQPLYVPGVTLTNQGTHNVLYVATAHDSVYAFDADSGTQYWRVSLGTPVPSSVIGTENILVEVGIISTPVIDASSGTLYVTAKTYENGTQIFRMHALDIASGAEKFGGPVEVAASVSGSGAGSGGGRVTFSASLENQRPAVSLVNGIVYLAFSSHEDNGPYHGWLLGYDAKTLRQVQVFNDTPNSGQGGIWMGGQGLVADAANNLYLITGNSTRTTENMSADYGESFLKFVPSGSSLTVADYFKPFDYDHLNAQDIDLGATGAFLIPGTSYIAGGSKSGMLYLLDTNNMGKLNLASDQVVQEFQADNGLWGSPAFWNNTLYIWGMSGSLRAYAFLGTHFNTSSSSRGAYVTSAGATSGSVSVSSNGTKAGTGIVWATAPAADPDHATVGGNLFALDAADLTHLLWSTQQNPSRDGYGNYAKFVAPTIANGKVYVGTDSGRIAVYGLLPSGQNLIADGTYTIVNHQSGLAVDDPGFSTLNSQVMDQWTINGGNNQKWHLTNLGNNVIELINAYSGKALEVAQGSTANGALVDQNPYAGTPSQQWKVVSVSSGVYEVTNVHSGQALQIAGGSTSNGAQVDQVPYAGSPWQQWSFQSGAASTVIADGTYTIVNQQSGMAIDDPAFSTLNNQVMDQWTINGGNNQKWHLTNLGNNVIELINAYSGKALEVAQASTANGALVDQNPYSGNPSQQWKVVSVGGGTYEVTNVHSGQALQIAGGSTSTGAQVDQAPYAGSAWQQWSFR